MSKKPIISFRGEPGQDEALDRLCAVTERDRAWHLRRALAEYLAKQLWQAESVLEGIADAEAGNLVSLEDVTDRWKAGARSGPTNKEA